MSFVSTATSCLNPGAIQTPSRAALEGRARCSRNSCLLGAVLACCASFVAPLAVSAQEDDAARRIF